MSFAKGSFSSALVLFRQPFFTAAVPADGAVHGRGPEGDRQHERHLDRAEYGFGDLGIRADAVHGGGIGQRIQAAVAGVPHERADIRIVFIPLEV